MGGGRRGVVWESLRYEGDALVGRQYGDAVIRRCLRAVGKRDRVTNHVTT